MLRRSVLLFAGFGLLCLVLIVGYALTGLSGPQSAIDRAAQQLAERRPDRALADLYAAERTLGANGDPELIRKVLELRLEAHRMTADYRRALATLGELIDRFPAEEPEHERLRLEHERLRLWIASGDPARARDRALELLRAARDNGRTLELAGEASQRLYQDRLGALTLDLSAKLPPVAYREAVQALLPYLYRRADDPLAADGKQRFDEILRRYRNPDYVGETYRAAIDQIRTLVEQTQAYYERSLAAPGGSPVSAFRGLAYGLQQGRRYDDVLALAEVYLRRFDHVFTTQAAVSAARVHEDAGRHEAVLELCNRFLPSGTWRERLERKGIDSEVRHLLLCKARALHALGDAKGLTALADEVVEMSASGKLDLAPQQDLIQAYARDAAGDAAGAERSLASFVQHPSVAAQPAAGEDLFTTAMRLRLAEARQAALRFDQIETMLGQWITARPDDFEPVLERARHRMAGDKPDEAFFDAKNALDLAGRDEAALRVYAQAADNVFAVADRDARALLAQCIDLQVSLERLPVADEALYLVLADLAMQGNHYEIARQAARQAADHFSWARWPRELWARAAIALAAAEPHPDQQRTLRLEAVNALEGRRRFHPDDNDGLRLLRRARRAAGMPIDDLLYDLALAGEPDADVARGLLASCLARGDQRLAAHFTGEIRRRYGRDPEVALLVTDVLAATGDPNGALAILAPLAQVVLGRGSPLGPRVAERLLEVEARLRHADGVRALLPAVRELHRSDAAALYRMAQMLDARGMYEPAYAMLQPILTDAVHAAVRSGVHFMLAGELALRCDELEAATEHFTAAMSFPDGAPAGRSLALLLLRDGEVALAADVPRDTTVESLADAALMLRLGRPELVDSWIAAAQQRDPLNLCVACLQAVRTERGRFPQDVRDLARDARDALLDVLLFPEVAGFERHGLERATELRAQYPANAIARYLWARAAARAGDERGALTVLWELADQNGLIAAYDEIVRIIGETDRAKLSDPALNAKIAAVVPRIEAMAPPRLRAMLLWNYVQGLTELPNPPEGSLDLLARFWIEFHDETRSGWPQLQALVAFGRHRDALDLFDILERKCPATARPQMLSLFAAQVRAITAAGADPEITVRAIDRVRGLIESDGPHGGLVHVLLEQQDRELGPIGDRLDSKARARIAAEKALLERHIALFREGRDPDVGTVILSLRRLQRLDLEGNATALLRAEDLLHHDPSLVPVWIERARLLEDAGRPAEAVRGLRWLFDYINDANVLLETCRIAGQAGIATAADEQRLLRDLAPWAANTPAAALARGLVALRLARYTEAAQMLEKAGRRADGAPLFYRALANLPLPGGSAGALAGQLLRQLANEYPDSRVCEIADHLAAQLALPTPEATPPRGK